MSFSYVHWIMFSVLDFILKAGCTYLIGGAISLGLAPLSIFIWLAFIWWIFHLLFLGVARGLLAFFKFSRRLNFFLTLLMGEALFALVAGLSFVSDMSSNLFRCPPGRTSCPWDDITASEIQSVVWMVLFLVMLNLLPILISVLLAAVVNLTRRLLQKRSESAITG